MSSNGSLRVSVRDSTADAAVQGAKISVTSNSTSQEETGVTDIHGEVAFVLVPGAYTVRHGAPGQGYLLLPSDNQQTATVTPTGSTNVEFKEVKGVRLKVVVRNPLKDPKPLEGARVTIKSAALERLMVTSADPNGELLLPGTYTVIETAPPDGYLLGIPATKEVSLVQGKDVAEVVFDSPPAGTIKIRAVDRTDVKKRLAGAVVNITAPGETTVSRQVVTTDGEPAASAPNLKPGAYIVTEERSPDAYELPIDRTRTVAVTIATESLVDFAHDKKQAARSSWSDRNLSLLSVMSWLLLLAVVAYGVWAFFFSDYDAIAFAMAIEFVGLGLLAILGGKRGFFAPLVGADNRISTSKSQVGLWTVVLVGALSYLLGRVLFQEQQLATVLPQARWDEYLILLGGPFAAAVIAKGIVNSRVEDGSIQKPDNAGMPGLNQLVKNDAEHVDLIDSQYLLFNLVAIAYFLFAIYDTRVLPEMPSTLLAMTSGAAALFAANKAVETNRPIITSVTPATLTPLVDIRVTGQNFIPPGSDPTARVSVELEGVGSLAVIQQTNEEVSVMSPPKAEAGYRKLTVTSTGGVASNEWQVWVPDDFK